MVSIDREAFSRTIISSVYDQIVFRQERNVKVFGIKRTS